jgi:hypothetical protein
VLRIVMQLVLLLVLDWDTRDVSPVLLGLLYSLGLQNVEETVT